MCCSTLRGRDDRSECDLNKATESSGKRRSFGFDVNCKENYAQFDGDVRAKRDATALASACSFKFESVVEG
jgi:hypothetical protein